MSGYQDLLGEDPSPTTPRRGVCYRIDRNAGRFQHLIVAPCYREDPPVAYVGRPMVDYGVFTSMPSGMFETHTLPPAFVPKKDKQSLPKKGSGILLQDDNVDLFSRENLDLFSNPVARDLLLDRACSSAFSEDEPVIFPKELETHILPTDGELTPILTKFSSGILLEKNEAKILTKNKPKTFSKKVETGSFPKKNTSKTDKTSKRNVLPENKATNMFAENDLENNSKEDLGIMSKDETNLFSEEAKEDTLPDKAELSSFSNKSPENMSVNSNQSIVSKYEPNKSLKKIEPNIMLQKDDLEVSQKKKNTEKLRELRRPSMIPNKFKKGNLMDDTITRTISNNAPKTSPKKVDAGALSETYQLSAPRTFTRGKAGGGITAKNQSEGTPSDGKPDTLPEVQPTMGPRRVEPGIQKKVRLAEIKSTIPSERDGPDNSRRKTKAGNLQNRDSSRKKADAGVRPKKDRLPADEASPGDGSWCRHDDDDDVTASFIAVLSTQMSELMYTCEFASRIIESTVDVVDLNALAVKRALRQPSAMVDGCLSSSHIF
ncbi:uncharacterized protein LOC134543187 [Bacillus rossius redtenbacheri]|uniref:uncharacterized protein LOC134543187 n=1 Tax=Bacillus rossius redtenbacheri TaxID=93214 RepID=UPI002FDD49D2